MIKMLLGVISVAKKNKNKFDVIMMIGVMDHISDLEIEQAMESIKKLVVSEVTENGKRAKII